ncbi:MAG: AzlD domain-containing protein [Betaproteobacteria bacterium]|nr:AzlD domain-containing protein [Betaproteobacteria bacterium]
MLELALLVLACGAATDLWRWLGVPLSGRVPADSEVFAWIGCVAYAMVASLIARMVILPSGVLTATLLSERLLACAVGLVAYYAGRRNLLLGILAGFVVIVVSGWLRGGSP